MQHLALLNYSDSLQYLYSCASSICFFEQKKRWKSEIRMGRLQNAATSSKFTLTHTEKDVLLIHPALCFRKQNLVLKTKLLFERELQTLNCKV